MATDACTLFATLIDTEVRAWSAVESALSEVAASQGITLGAASRLVDRLHRDGLLHRTPCEHDRRATILTVTDRGLAHLEEACAVVEKEQERLFAPLSTAQREELTRCLALIAEAAKERA